MRNQIDKEAEKWYIDLRHSNYRYLAQYKQRIDSLLSYQKTLHEIISTTKKDEVKIRAISELHSIEMDIFNLWKQLPASNIANTIDDTDQKKVEWVVQIDGTEEKEKKELTSVFNPGAWTVDGPDQVEVEQKAKPAITTSLRMSTDPEPDTDNPSEPEPKQEEQLDRGKLTETKQQKNDVIDIDVLGRWPMPFDIDPWVQCNFVIGQGGWVCDKWFKNNEIRAKHVAKYHT